MERMNLKEGDNVCRNEGDLGVDGKGIVSGGLSKAG